MAIMACLSVVTTFFVYLVVSDRTLFYHVVLLV